MTDRTHFVYTALDAQGRALYVGCTKDPDQRYRSHMSGNGDARGWFQEYVTRWRVAGPLPSEYARQLERERINAFQPIFNGHSKANRLPDQWGVRRVMANTYIATRGLVDIRNAA